MPVSSLTLLERIARVLAGRELSGNAKGDDLSAGAEVDERWHEYVGDALAILHTLREPDRAMAAAGDPDMWERMVEAALAVERDRPAGDGSNDN
ncbi:hypothetical protein [Sphingosinicella rhizophila]|uniref:Uncharacterized protein n=1 Tax=Sphingosinicella rhizophila TaxID=3050082 RepID=A0ABU3QA62_9SPHN|nr:hypothetical protein [Sphingosinicella sp. GR2756]MDT9600019.1 hypothetical protein [Sphingosinicella sp. GR2756]